LVKISFDQRLSIADIKASDINMSNTDINIIPYREPGSENLLNLTKYNLTWKAISLTEKELYIQLNFTEPGSISRY